MPYRLQADETISYGMRRLLLERVGEIIVDLTEAPKGRDKGVHDARKSCKRIRAAYRLIRDEIGRDLYRQENIRFRDTARLLAKARDTWVMIRTLDMLVATHEDQLPQQAFSGIRQNLTELYEATLAQELKDQTTIPAVLNTLDEACHQIENLPIEREDFSAFGRSIRRVYARGRRAMRLSYTQPSSEIFHEWRKRVKYLWYQLEILEALWPNILSQLADELHSLSEYLGDDHDLAVLRTTVLDSSAGFENELELLTLVQLIDQARLELEALAQPLGERIYFDPPKTFVRRLETYWQAWQIEDDKRQNELIDDIQNRSPVYIRLDKELLTTSEIAAGLEISPQRVRKLIYERKLPAEKVGPRWVIRADSPPIQDPDAEEEQTYLGILLSTKDVASHLKIRPRKVRRLIQAGELPAIKMGQQWIILEEDLINFNTNT
jgi:excisionase family DNA binding protein